MFKKLRSRLGGFKGKLKQTMEEEIEDGSEVMVPVGGGIMIAAKVSRGDKVLTSVGNNIVAEMGPKDAARRVGERRDEVREMIQQVKAGIEQTEAQAQALSQQAETAFQALQASKEQGL